MKDESLVKCPLCGGLTADRGLEFIECWSCGCQFQRPFTLLKPVKPKRKGRKNAKSK